MNRLTYKTSFTMLDEYFITKKQLFNCYDKLQKLEDLEEELGCPLDIFINIMLGKITKIVVNYDDANGYKPLYEKLTIAYVDGIIDSYEYPDCLCLDTNLCEIPINDYQKNWWLEGEKENA